MKILDNTAEWYFLMIKISIIGQSAFGESVAKEIFKMKETIISSVFASSNPKDPLNQFALENNLPVKNFKRLRDNEELKALSLLMLTCLLWPMLQI